MGAEAIAMNQMKRTYPELVRHVCEHPEMYVGERRFRSVAAWLDGYSCGQHDNENDTENVLGMDGFPKWLSEKFYESHGIERNLSWEGHILRLYRTDDEALKQLPILIDEFVNQTGVTCEPVGKKLLCL
jgi:hypothetical protein